MRRVVLFKRESGEYAAACAARGLTAEFVEPLEFGWVNEESLRDALLEPWDALCVSSERGAEAVGRVWQPAMLHGPVYAVGQATARAVHARLGVEARWAVGGSGLALGALLADEVRQGGRVVWARGQLAGRALGDIVRSRGLRLSAVTAYETRPHHSLQAVLPALVERASAGQVHALAFFSPSGAQLVLEGPTGEAFRALPLFAIGSTTAEALTSLQAPAAGVAEHPDAESLIEVISKYFTNESTKLNSSSDVMQPNCGGVGLLS